MVLVRVIARLLCSSQSDAESVRDAINQKLSTKVAVTVNSPVAAELVTPTTWGVTGDVAFTLKLDATDIRDDVVAKWGSGQYKNKILAGSRVTLHVCAHNDGEPPPHQNCREREYELRAKS